VPCICKESQRPRDDPAAELDDHEPAGEQRCDADARRIPFIAAMLVVVRIMIVVMRVGMGMRMFVTVGAQGMIVSHAFSLGSAGAEIK
jgi:hypothetical protein